jgi:hypothetical protein
LEHIEKRMQEYLNMMHQMDLDVRNVLTRERQAREEQIRASTQAISAMQSKQVQDLATKLELRLENESITRQSTYQSMVDGLHSFGNAKPPNASVRSCSQRLPQAFAPGMYKITQKSAVGPDVKLGETLRALEVGQLVRIVEVQDVVEDKRIRGRLLEGGWISMKNTTDGSVWVTQASEASEASFVQSPPVTSRLPMTSFVQSPPVTVRMSLQSPGRPSVLMSPASMR